MTQIFNKEWHKQEARKLLMQARDMNKNFIARDWLVENKPHRVKAAKAKAVMFYLNWADAHLKIALGQRPVFDKIIIN